MPKNHMRPKVARLRARLDHERREHRQTLLLLDAVTVARDRAEAALEKLRMKPYLNCDETWFLPNACVSSHN